MLAQEGVVSLIYGFGLTRRAFYSSEKRLTPSNDPARMPGVRMSNASPIAGTGLAADVCRITP